MLYHVAVDAHVGQHLFEQCIMTLKQRNKCIILVTNALQFLRSTTSIVVLRDGQVVENGTYDELLSTGYWLNEMINTHLDSSNGGGLSKNNSLNGLEKELAVLSNISEQDDDDKKAGLIRTANDARDKLTDAIEEKLNQKLQLEVAGKEEIDRITNIKPKSSLLLSESGKLLTIEEKGVGDVGLQVHVHVLLT